MISNLLARLLANLKGRPMYEWDTPVEEPPVPTSPFRAPGKALERWQEEDKLQMTLMDIAVSEFDVESQWREYGDSVEYAIKEHELGRDMA